MHIVLVEDDWLQAEWIESHLREAFDNVKVERISTEQEFYSRFEDIAEACPDVFIVDTMLRWADPKPDMELPPLAVQENGFYRAGLRCKDEIIKYEKTRNTPIILYTILEELDLEPALQDMPQSIFYLRKDSDSTPLIQILREVLLLGD